MQPEQRIAIIGASGYTGAELIRLLLTHPFARIAVFTGDSQAGKTMRDVYPHLAFAPLPPLMRLEDVDYSAVAIVFCCLPHGTTQRVIAGLPEHLKIIDLSADFRLMDTALYATWYGHAHRAPELQKQAVYGLSELARKQVAGARLVANPGCYPTAAQLPLIPLLKAGLIEAEGIVIDAKSGVTGAGRAPRQSGLFTEIDGGLSAYAVGTHRHTPEIEQGLAGAVGKPVMVSFTPHLAPMNRGILATLYVTCRAGENASTLKACLENTYENEPFVKVMNGDVVPSTHSVRGTNICAMNVFADRVPSRAVIVSVIDNLVKGASGQAIQNMNLMCGWPETAGLLQTALFP